MAGIFGIDGTGNGHETYPVFLKVFRSSIILIAVFLTLCSRPENASSTPPDGIKVESIRNVTIEILVNAEWVEDVRVTNQFMKFEANGNFRHKISFEGCGASNGRFRIENQKVTFFNIQEVEGCTPWFSEKTVCQVISTPNDIDFQEYLKCKAHGAEKWPHDFEFVNKKLPQKVGASITLSGMLSTVIKSKSARISENAVFRKMPSTSAPRASYRESIDCSSGNPEEQSYLPKGQKINILARTQQKITVDKWHNYWYYICPITCEVYMGEGCYFRGWVYGEFIKQ